MGDDARLEVRVLGPLQVTAPDGRDVTPTGPLGRRLLALLVLRRGRVTPVDLAAEALWPDTSHEHGGALQSQVSRLRRGLPDGVIDSVDGGYRLRPEAVRLDADELAALLIGTKPDAAATAELDRLLAAWHGPAYPELADTDLGREEAARLGELGVRAAEFRATASKKPSARDLVAVRSAAATASEEAAGAGLVNFALLVTATVTNPGGRREAQAAIDMLAATARIRLRPVYGSQDAAFAACLPLGLVLSKHAKMPSELTEAM